MYNVVDIRKHFVLFRFLQFYPINITLFAKVNSIE